MTDFLYGFKSETQSGIKSLIESENQCEIDTHPLSLQIADSILSKPNITQLNSTQSNSKVTLLRLDIVVT